jgi:hypothetical protein
MTYRLTRESARAAGACYSDARVAALVPPEGLAPTEVAALDIPPEDRVWALTCACGTPRDLWVVFARACEERAVDYAAATAAADRAVGSVGADVAARAAAVASAAAADAHTYVNNALAYVRMRAARGAAFGAARAAARAAAAAAAAADRALGFVAAFGAVSDAGWLAECQWQVNTLVELLSHTHPQIEG